MQDILIDLLWPIVSRLYKWLLAKRLERAQAALEWLSKN